MQFASALLLAAAAIGSVAAHPSPAAHRHARFHEKSIEARGNKFVINVKPVSSAAEPTPEPSTAPAAASTPAAPAPAAPSASSGSSSGSVGKKAFCSGSASSKRATAYDIAYAGNTGTADNWGCNIMQVDCGTIDLYDYTAKFTGLGRETNYACSAFNKIGPKGDIDGFWFSALDFNVASGQSLCLAFDTNSQGGVACGVNSVPRTSIGQLAGTWLEFDAGSAKNDNQSGSDHEDRRPGKGTCSNLIKSNLASSVEVYRAGMEDLDGVGCTGYSKGTIYVTLGE
ncbi:unnamed protein product [Parascedosporium putredinis]|uniref:Allergen Asp f 4 n=1 Tax=Parascedosporium putredinis TaxID=1442378 RepID=A0A9P1MF18_9PEZI|nr:unnamed protein product [Parascedosporium putredinis]CAI8002542.1 unnamed protein product [Parascedosporium putredinis]